MMAKTGNSHALTDKMLAAGGKDAQVLKRFMREFFPFGAFRKIGVFSKEMRGDYYAQAEQICHILGYNTVFEYGAEEIRCHITCDKRPPGAAFVEVIPSIYE